MRIIQVIDVRWFNACADFAIKQALGLKLCGHEILLMANPGSPPAVKARQLGLDVSEEIDFAGVIGTFRAVKLLKSLVRNFDADIVFAHRGESHLIGALAVRNMRCKLARFRGDVRVPGRGIFSRWLNNRLTNGIAVSSEKLKHEYENRFRLNGIPTSVIYPGIDSAPFEITRSKREMKQKFGLDPERPVIGIIGRFSPVKGHRYFIEAAKIVSLRHPEAQFIIAGEDAQLSALDLSRSAAILKIPGLKIIGLLDNVNELIQAFDIGVVSSVGSEMICRVLLEYFAAGLPVVATAVNQVSELMLISNGGRLVAPADPVALADGMVGLLENPGLRLQHSRSGAEWVRRRSLTDLGKDSEEFLREVLNAKQDSH